MDDSKTYLFVDNTGRKSAWAAACFDKLMDEHKIDLRGKALGLDVVSDRDRIKHLLEKAGRIWVLEPKHRARINNLMTEQGVTSYRLRMSSCLDILEDDYFNWGYVNEVVRDRCSISNNEDPLGKVKLGG